MRDTWSRQDTLINDFNAAINAFWPDHRPLPGREPAQSKSSRQTNGLATGLTRNPWKQPEKMRSAHLLRRGTADHPAGLKINPEKRNIMMRPICNTWPSSN
jgi:hypothetical protein